jgi:hypothetical protein
VQSRYRKTANGKREKAFEFRAARFSRQSAIGNGSCMCGLTIVKRETANVKYCSTFNLPTIYQPAAHKPSINFITFINSITSLLNSSTIHTTFP